MKLLNLLSVRIGLFILLGILLTWLSMPGMKMEIFPSYSNNDPSDLISVFPNNKPWYRAHPGEVVRYAITVNKSNNLQVSSFRLLPDDCVANIILNGREIFKNKSLACAYDKGISFTLSPYWVAGKNTLNIIVYNRTSTVGLDLYADFFNDNTAKLLFYYWAGLWFAIILLVAKRLKLSNAITACFCLSTLMLFSGGMSYTYHFFTHDLGAHADHISFLYTHWWRSDPFLHAGFRYPSLYYLLIAWLTRAGNYLLLGGLVWKLSSFFFYNVFLLAGLKVIEKTLRNLLQRHIAQAVFLLWPLHSVIAFHVNNDIPFYAFCTLSLLAWISYVQRPNLQQLCLAAGVTSLSLLIKFNTLVLAFTILAALWIRRDAVLANIKEGWLKERLLLAALIMTPIMSLGIGPLYSAYKAHQLPYDPGIYGAQGTGGAILLAQNNAASYVVPTAASLIDSPYIQHGIVESKQNLWAYLAKTMLFGEFGFPNAELAQVMMMSLCLFLLPAIAYLFFLSIKDLSQNPALLLNVLFLLGSIVGIIFFRAQYHQTASQDFRYIVPCLIPLIIAWCSMVSHWQKKGLVIFSILGYASAIVLIGSGIIFYELFYFQL